MLNQTLEKAETRCEDPFVIITGVSLEGDRFVRRGGEIAGWLVELLSMDFKALRMPKSAVGCGPEFILFQLAGPTKPENVCL